MIKKNLLLFILIFLLYPTTSFADYHSPIVQIVAYKDIFGKYFSNVGWGSASIIDDKGTIITNNHVVDDGKEGAYTKFSICISYSEIEKPTCKYTATLINRDSKKDIALLRIDEIDIYGSKIDLSKLQKIEPDFSYIPKSGDVIEAVGFPWVGSETITRTQGIVSGTSDYNDATYIKSDTLIAGGNSGGAYTKDGKLIGIPTFGIGGFTESSLSYGLLISEAQEFITQNISKNVSNQIDRTFQEYRKKIEVINTNKKLNDSIIKIELGNDYQVMDYIQGKSIVIGPLKQNFEIPSSIQIYLSDLPNIRNQEEFLYVLQDLGLYNKESQKLKKIKVDGLDFYQPINTYDVSGGEADGERIIFANIEGNLLTIQGIFRYDLGEDMIKKINAHFDSFLNRISINRSGIKNTSFSTSFLDPYFEIKQNTNVVYNEINGGGTIYPFKNLHEYIGVYLIEQDIYTGKGKDRDTIYVSETKDITQNMKSKIQFLGYDGYIMCSDSSILYKGVQTDEKGNALDQSSCSIKIFGIKNSTGDYILTINLITNKKNIKTGLEALIKSLPKIVFLQKKGNGETKITNILSKKSNLLFTDIKGQSEAYKSNLDLLVTYGIIENSTKFDPYKPIKWGQYIDMYLSKVYKINLETSLCKKDNYRCKLKNYTLTLGTETKSIAYFLDLIGVKLENYVNSEKISSFNDIIDMMILGNIHPKTLTEEFLAKYSTRKNEKEIEEVTKKVQEGFYNLYGTRKISFSEVGGNYETFWATKNLYFTQEKGIVEELFYQKGGINLGKIKPIPEFQNMKFYYPVLTKHEALNQITNLVDFGLYDSEIAKKKDTNIENNY